MCPRCASAFRVAMNLFPHFHCRQRDSDEARYQHPVRRIKRREVKDISSPRKHAQPYLRAEGNDGGPNQLPVAPQAETKDGRLVASAIEGVDELGQGQNHERDRPCRVHIFFRAVKHVQEGSNGHDREEAALAK